MRTSTTVQPEGRGARKFFAQYGDRPVCVRYRSDERQKKRCKTIELIVEEWPWTPPPSQQGDHHKMGARQLTEAPLGLAASWYTSARRLSVTPCLRLWCVFVRGDAPLFLSSAFVDV